MTITMLNGQISDSAVNAQDLIRVAVPNLDYLGRRTVGPMGFTPRIRPDGSVRYPSRGDRALVAVDDSGPSWIAEWSADEVGPIPSSLDPTIVTSIPSTPYDGQEIYYRLAQTVNPVDATVLLWHLKWDTAAAYWLPVGEQAPLYAFDGPVRSAAFSPNTWGGLGATDPSVTIPLAGDYRLEWSDAQSLSTASINHWMGIKIGATEPTINSDNASSGHGLPSTWEPSGVGSYKANGITAGTVCQVRHYAQTTASTLSGAGRYVKAYPRRINDV